ncbi:CDP-alcohol phosphatidyltransferase family protein [uncultured Desulfuromonas sp.]|uniref:CDP-alcohol phosphatidyltransferase family protein n=1 Tax=uncultured Desulfuromonas sp. TaxID=181013 RepID=UPI00262FD34C|nr:CDP-alcohol phosphatidyltransferase family protein [uncultured Desulfuromonas sp.]
MAHGMNIPNALTLLRLLLVPGFLIAVIYGRLPAALTLFVVAAITDFLDGLLARILGQETLLGAYLDPVADKLLCITAFVSLAAVGVLPAWLAVLVVAKDLYAALGALIVLFCNRPLPEGPSPWGKLATGLELLTAGIALLAVVVGAGGAFLPPLFALTGAMTAVAGLHYVVGGVLFLSR